MEISKRTNVENPMHNHETLPSVSNTRKTCATMRTRPNLEKPFLIINALFKWRKKRTQMGHKIIFTCPFSVWIEWIKAFKVRSAQYGYFNETFTMRSMSFSEYRKREANFEFFEKFHVLEIMSRLHNCTVQILK